MSDYYCDKCDKTIKLQFKTKHLKTRLHRDLFTSIINRYCFKNPIFLEIGDILKTHVYENNERFGFYFIMCEWKLDFVDVILCVKSRESIIYTVSGI